MTGNSEIKAAPFRAVGEMVSTYARRRPGRMVAIVVAFIIASIIESIGFLGLLPLFSVAQGQELPADRIGQAIAAAFAVLALTPTLGAITAAIIVAMLLKAAIRVAAEAYLAHSVSTLMTEMRLRLLAAVSRASWSYFVGQSSGQLATLFASESQRSATGMNNSLKIISLLCQGLAFIMAALLVSWTFTAICVASALIIAAALHGLVYVAQRTGAELTMTMNSIVESMIDGLQNYKPLKAMAREGALVRLLKKDALKFQNAYFLNAISVVGLMHVRDALAMVVFGVALCLSLSSGGVPFADALVIVVLGYKGVGRLGEMQRVLQGVAGSYQSYRFVEDVTAKAEAAAERLADGFNPTFESEIAFRDVSFRHGHRIILKNVRFKIPARGITALIGPSGAGKTTVVELILGFREPESGEILIDGVPLAACDMYAWRRRLGYVPQEVQLFQRSILENIRLGDADISPEQVTDALAAAGAWDWVQSLPQGLETNAGVGGQKFSGGQRQRIALARALVHRPQFLLLDEATSALDPETETLICQTLRNLADKISIFAVSHQQGIISIADNLLRIENGVVTAVERQPTAMFA